MQFMERARVLAQARKVLIDTVEEYEKAFVFSYSKGINLSGVEYIVVMKETAEVLTLDDISREELGKKIAEKSI